MSSESFEQTPLFRRQLLELGFDLIGFTKAERLKLEESNFKIWLEKNFDADMTWIKKDLDKRIDPFKILPEAKSVISLGLNYYQKGDFSNQSRMGKVSRYAWGNDYHKVFEKKFKSVRKILLELDPQSKNKFYIDYGPTMDKIWAVRSGLGWMGKHTNVISTSIGSWFFIGTILTTIEFEYDLPILDLCGECDLCMIHCPTNALVEPYVLDSNKCISYQTIENNNEIPQELKGKFENFVFGCDICQEVCPWNLKLQTETNQLEFASNIRKEINLEEIIHLSETEFNERFKESPIKRAGLKGLKRNLEFIQS